MNQIEDYGFIGDGFGSALISLDGCVDWLTLRRFDSDPLCWSLLDDEKGATLRVKPQGEFKWKHHYLEGTNILVTEAFNEESRLVFYDFMPVARTKESSTHDYTSLVALHGLVRFVKVFGRPVEIEITHITSNSRNFLFMGKTELELTKESSVELEIDQSETFSLFLTDRNQGNLHIENMKKYFKVTKAFWQEWIGYSQYKGPHAHLINRSALTLKLLIHARTGAIMAAPTTSLPEVMGGERNWDYRYCWLRDATFTLYALSYLGFSGEADKFSSFMETIAAKTKGPLKILYSLDGNPITPEREIRGIRGYQGSTPVRVGNDAYKQTQLDTHGEFVDWAYLHHRLGGKLSDCILAKIEETAKWVVENWKEKDRGIWEIRGEDEDYTYSKVMCWVTLDRAGSLLGDLKLFEKEKKEIEEYIKNKCMHAGRLCRSRQNNGLEASLLLIKIVGFPVEEEIFERTVDAIIDELGTGPFIKRYKEDDGLKGKEGDFIICSFWAVNACLFLGRYDQAKERLEELLKHVSDLGLLSEEYDVEKGHFLGNFPQALSHLALIETASYFELYQRGGKKALSGCHGDRASSMHTTLHGPRAVWNFLLKTGEFKKLFPSSKSKLS